MALPGSIEIVRLSAQSGDLEFALDVIREFAWKNEDLTQIFIENDGVETILDLIRESEDRSIRFKACDTLGKLASKNDSVRNTIEGAGIILSQLVALQRIDVCRDSTRRPAQAQ
mgnify:CR=1 FL=1